MSKKGYDTIPWSLYKKHTLGVSPILLTQNMSDTSECVYVWGGGGFPHQQFSNTSWMSSNVTEFWRYVSGDPTGAQFHKTAPILHSRSQLQVSDCYLCFWLIGYKFGFPWPPLGLNNFLEWLTELRETRLLIMIKNMIKNTDKHLDGRDT